MYTYYFFFSWKWWKKMVKLNYYMYFCISWSFCYYCFLYSKKFVKFNFTKILDFGIYYYSPPSLFSSSYRLMIKILTCLCQQLKGRAWHPAWAIWGAWRAEMGCPRAPYPVLVPIVNTEDLGPCTRPRKPHLIMGHWTGTLQPWVHIVMWPMEQLLGRQPPH